MPAMSSCEAPAVSTAVLATMTDEVGRVTEYTYDLRDRLTKVVMAKGTPAESSEEFKSLARRLGYRQRDRSKGAALLAGDIRQTMAKVHQYFVSRFDKGK